MDIWIYEYMLVYTQIHAHTYTRTLTFIHHPSICLTLEQQGDDVGMGVWLCGCMGVWMWAYGCIDVWAYECMDI